MNGQVSEALHSLSKELQATIQHASRALESFVEDKSNTEALDVCAADLHTVFGALKVADVAGGAQLAEEMEQVTRNLLSTNAPQMAESLDVLSQALLQLPVYLERVQTGGRDIPLVLLPLLNDLRTVRGAPLLSENTLFLLNLSAADVSFAEDLSKKDAADAAALSAQLRPKFQSALLGWITNDDPKTNLNRLVEICEQFQEVSRVPVLFRMWRITAAVLEALADDGLEASASLKRLLGQVDRQCKRLIDKGESVFEADPPEELLNNLLYYVARASSSGKRISEVRETFNLGAVMPEEELVQQERDNLAAPSPSLMQTVASAIKEDLARVKDGLDIYVRAGVDDVNQLAPQKDALSKIADTMSVLGLTDLKDQVDKEADRFDELGDGDFADTEANLMDMAATLLRVEDRLGTQLNDLIAVGQQQDEPLGPEDADYAEVRSAVIRECIVNLARVKDAIVHFLERPDSPQIIQDVPQQIHGIRSGMLMLQKDRVRDILGRIEDYTRARLLQGNDSPEENEIDRVADAIVSVEYYLETIQKGRKDPWYMLDNAEACLEVLSTTPVIPEEFVAETVVDVGEEEAFPLDIGEPEKAPAEVHEPTEIMEKVAPPVFANDNSRADPEFLELFIEEAKEEVETIAEHLPRWRDNPMDQDSLASIRRSYHTLKGSGRMVGAELIGEFSWSMENLLNRLLDGTLERNDHIVLLMEQSVGALPELIEQLEVGSRPRTDIDELMQKAWALADKERGDTQITSVLPPKADDGEDDGQTEVLERPMGLEEHDPTEIIRHPPQQPYEPTQILQHPPGETVDGGLEPLEPLGLVESDEPLEVESAPTREPIEEDPTGIMLREDFFSEFAEDAVPEDDQDEEDTTIVEQPADLLDQPETPEAPPAPIVMDEALLEVFAKESNDHLATIRGFIEEANERDGPYKVGEPLHRATHTLHGSANAAAVAEVVQVATPMDHYISELFNSGVRMPEAGVSVLEDFVSTMDSLLACINRSGAVLPDSKDLLARIEALEAAHQDVEISTEGLEVGEFVDEGADAPETTDTEDDGSTTIVKELVEIQTAEPPIETPPASEEYDPEIAAIFAEEATELLDSADSALRNCKSQENVQAFAQLKRDLHTLKGGARMAGVTAMGNLSHLLETVIIKVEDRQLDFDRNLFESVQAGLDSLHRMRDRLDGGEAVGSADKITARLEALVQGVEAPELEPETPSLRTTVVADDLAGDLSVDPTPTEMSVGFEEDLTQDSTEFLSALEPPEELSEELETTPEPAESEAFEVASEEPTEEPLELELAPEPAVPVEESEAEVVLDRSALPDPAAIPRPPAAAVRVIETPPVVQPEPPVEEPAPTEERRIPKAVPLFTPEKVVPRLEPVERQEVARVGAELLQRLLDNAGEISIYRARLEQQLGSIDFNLEELSRTVVRVHEQLRNLEIETEAQILHTHKDEGDDHPDFDPLELDRYSTLQQLTRAMAESANDLSSIQGLLENYTREADKLLLQQSRVTTELQDGLMRTRMVPFHHRGQRLARIVRQTASDVDKRAELQLHGTGEIDRQMLERMMPPLEHMVRNAVIHGIETPHERLLAGKPEIGTVQIRLHREGSEMVLEIADDGQGLDVDAIRVKALDLGMIDQDRQLNESDVMQLIMEPGLTTAKELTQAAGRGVGMDVVANEIKQLGGSLFIDSTPGAGTTFTVRLPFTLAISQALLVRAAGNTYALPLPSIEGIARVSLGELESYLSANGPPFNYGGEKYQLQHLGVLLGGEASRISEEEATVPLIMVRAGEFSTALITDGTLDRQEIVVKSVGPQIGSIRGISGATILGDGSTAVILDPVALVRVLKKSPEAKPERMAQEDQRTFVMVVDDSITVRRVTERLLERNGMRVVTAKDGADAVALLQDQIPDVILLDIEMPRMDGYEVAAHVRNDPRLAEVPIIMITSRVGLKHRARAIELGVNDYLGKPYQEHQLLDAIEPLVQKKLGAET